MVLSAVLSDDEPATSYQLDPFDHEDMPHGTRTPPTFPSRSPLPTSSLSTRVRAVAQHRPVSIPDIVCDMAGKNPQQKLANFDRHYMPDGVQDPDVSVTGDTGEHRSNLKRKAKGIARSLAEVIAYQALPHVQHFITERVEKAVGHHHQRKLHNVI